MNSKLSTAFILAIAIGFAVSWHFKTQEQVGAKGEDQEEIRENLAIGYLAVKNNTAQDFEDRHEVLQARLENKENLSTMGLPIAILYALEGNGEEAKKILDRLPETKESSVVRYAFAYSDTLPETWEEQLPQDWLGISVAARVYDRLNDDQSKTMALMRLRHLETRAEQTYNVVMIREVFNLLGIGLLVSMWLSNRHWKKLGRVFFPLLPIVIPREVLFRLFAFFLVGFVALKYLIQVTLGGSPFWLQHTVSYILSAVLGVYLMQRMLFAQSDFSLAETLGFSNLKMRFSNLFQIIGGLAIVTTCLYTSSRLAIFFGWPVVMGDDAYPEIMEQPVSAGVYILIACIVAPFFEEVLFRGLLFRGLLSSVSPFLAISISSMLFAVIHPIGIWPLAFAMGFGLAVIYYRTANILIVIWTHALWNFTSLMLSMYDLF